MRRNKCRVCGEDVIEVREGYTDHMTTLGGTFTYGVCGNCASLSILDVPADLKERYSNGYYSYAWDVKKEVTDSKKRTAAHLIKEFGLKEDSSVLDWGGGSLELCCAFFANGVGEDGKLHKLRCYDPFAEAQDHNGVKLQNTPPSDLHFDLIVSSHSIEHTESYRDTLQTMAACLAPGGKIYLVHPFCDSLVHIIYKEHAVSADAPRHLFIPTTNGCEFAIKDLGLKHSEFSDAADIFGLVMSNFYLQGMDYHKAQKEWQKDAGPINGKTAVVAEWIASIGMSDTRAYVVTK